MSRGEAAPEYNVSMERDEAIRRIKAAMPEFREKYRVAALSVFADSDVDVLADWDEFPNLDEFIGLKLALEEVLGCGVDLLDRAGLQPRWREVIEREALLVA